MSMTSVAAFRNKTRNVDNSVSSIQVSKKDLKFITGDQSEKKILKNQALNRMKAALNGASKTDFVYTDIRQEVRKRFFLAGPYMKDAHRSALQKEKTKPGRGDKKIRGHPWPGTHVRWVPKPLKSQASDQSARTLSRMGV